MDDDAPAKTGRWMRWALVVSLAVNLLVAGLVIGAVVSGPPERSGANRNRDMSLPYTRALDRDDQRAVRRTMLRDLRAQSDDGGPIADYRQALRLLRAEPFDAAAFMALQERQASRARDRFAVGQRALTAHLQDMTPAERAAYATRLEGEIARLAERLRPLRQQRD